MTSAVRTVAELRATLTIWRRSGERVALVPTMGALHAGHLSLIALARRRAERVVTSVFVNPRQFGPAEDLDAYPRTEAADLAALTAAGCDLMYVPSIGEMYPDDFATTVSVHGVSEPLDGAARPGHFDGVATVVAKLLIQAAPDTAVFGEKDYQQLLVIRRLVRDLDLPVEIEGAPIARDVDGLALSSRNAYLSPEERAVAGHLNRLLSGAVERLKQGAPVAETEAASRAELKASGFVTIDYVEVRTADDLRRLGPGPVGFEPARIFAAARVGRTRLIDNMAV